MGSSRTRTATPSPDRAIVALPVNPAYWRPGSRHIQLTYPDASGRYEIVGLPADIYLVAAIAGISAGDLYDLPIFQEIAAAGTEALVEADETTTLDLVLTLERNRLANYGILPTETAVRRLGPPPDERSVASPLLRTLLLRPD